MNFKIRNVDFIYDQDGNVSVVNIRFDATNGSVSINGVVNVTEEEYLTNATSFQSMVNLVKQKIQESISAS